MLLGRKAALEKALDKNVTAVKAAAKPAAKPAAKKGSLDLTDAGIAASMDAPAGAKAKEESWGDITIAIGEGDPHFGLTMAKGFADLAARKKELAANDLNKLNAYVRDTADAITHQI